MYKYTFLPKNVVSGFYILALVFCFFFNSYVISIILLMAPLFFYKKNKVSTDLKGNSLCSGKFMEAVGGDEFSFVIGPFDNYGLYFPYDGEVIRVTKQNSASMIEISSEKGIFTLELNARLQIENIYVEEGDRISANSCIGFFPLGGSLKLTTSFETKTLLGPGAKLLGGQTNFFCEG